MEFDKNARVESYDEKYLSRRLFMHVQLTGCGETLGAVWQIEEDGVIIQRWCLACLIHSLSVFIDPRYYAALKALVLSWLHVDAN